MKKEATAIKEDLTYLRQQFESQFIANALAQHGNDVSRTAEALGTPFRPARKDEGLPPRLSVAWQPLPKSRMPHLSESVNDNRRFVFDRAIVVDACEVFRGFQLQSVKS
jgi:hypothetical protein